MYIKTFEAFGRFGPPLKFKIMKSIYLDDNDNWVNDDDYDYRIPSGSVAHFKEKEVGTNVLIYTLRDGHSEEDCEFTMRNISDLTHNDSIEIYHDIPIDFKEKCEEIFNRLNRLRF